MESAIWQRRVRIRNRAEFVPCGKRKAAHRSGTELGGRRRAERCVSGLTGIGPDSVLRVGLAGDSVATVNHGDELGEAVIRLGLCCMFRDQPVKFVTTTATAISKMKRPDALIKLSRLCLDNADALLASLQFCAANNIGCFRIKAGKLDEMPLDENPYADLSSTVIPLFDVVFRQHLSMNSSLLLFKPSMAWFTSFNRRSH